MRLTLMLQAIMFAVTPAALSAAEAPAAALQTLADDNEQESLPGPFEDSVGTNSGDDFNWAVCSPEPSLDPGTCFDQNGCLAESAGRGSFLDCLLPRSNLPLPFMKELAGDQAKKLPLPLGASFIWTEMDRHIGVSDVRLGLGNTPPVSVDRISVPTTTFHASPKVARFDVWALPCLNVYGIVGHTITSGNVAVTVDRFPLPASPPVMLNIPATLEGTTAGYGVTAAAGVKDWFASVDFNQTWTNFTRLDSALTAMVITPRVGRAIFLPMFKGEVHVGAMWQDTNQTVNLTVDHPLLGNDLHVQVDQYEPNPWNFLVGGLWAIDERLHVMVEGGMGGRSYILTGITVRF